MNFFAFPHGKINFFRYLVDWICPYPFPWVDLLKPIVKTVSLAEKPSLMRPLEFHTGQQLEHWDEGKHEKKTVVANTHNLHNVFLKTRIMKHDIMWPSHNAGSSQSLKRVPASNIRTGFCFLSRWMMSLSTQTTWRWTVFWTFQRAQMKMERCFDLFLSSLIGWNHSIHTHLNLPAVFVCRRWPYIWWNGAVCLTKTPPGSWRLTSTSQK